MQSSPEISPTGEGSGTSRPSWVPIGTETSARVDAVCPPPSRRRVHHIGGLWPEAEGLRVRHATSRAATASARHVTSWGPRRRARQSPASGCPLLADGMDGVADLDAVPPVVATMSKASFTCSSSDEVDPSGVTWALARSRRLSTRKRSRSVLTLATAPRPHGRRRGAERASSLRRAQAKRDC